MGQGRAGCQRRLASGCLLQAELMGLPKGLGVEGREIVEAEFFLSMLTSWTEGDGRLGGGAAVGFDSKS